MIARIGIVEANQQWQFQKMWTYYLPRLDSELGCNLPFSPCSFSIYGLRFTENSPDPYAWTARDISFNVETKGKLFQHSFLAYGYRGRVMDPFKRAKSREIKEQDDQGSGKLNNSKRKGRKRTIGRVDQACESN
jgi:hypothetical protein